MTRRAVPFIAVCCAVLLGNSGCSRHVPSAMVILVDPSASVTERARRDEFAAVAELIPKLQRGDSLTVIPITDNAVADIQGRVLRLHVPDRREPYDADLRRFRADAERQLAAFAACLLASPGQNTDILGSLDAARQELDAIPGNNRRTLIVLSDFIEDDGALNFVSDQRLAGGDDAGRFGVSLRKVRRFKLPSTIVLLGAMQSGDFGSLDTARQTAVYAFWAGYLGVASGPETVQRDGTALFRHFQ